MASVDGKINILVDGLRKVKELNKELNKTSRSIGQINRRTIKTAVEKAQKQDKRRGKNFFTTQDIPNVKNLNKALSKASSNFNKVDISSDKAKVAAEELAKAEMALNQVLKEKNKLLAEAQVKLKIQNAPKPGELAGQTSPLNFGARGELLTGRAGTNRFGLKNLGRRFDKQSALIGGGFPLLFGGGPLQAAAGALGGGVGGMFGKMGGFAGSIAATAAVQTIQQTVVAIGNLGKAMSPFVQDTNALVDSMGLAGTAEGERIKIIEQLEGKQAAFNTAMQKMKETIGTVETKRLEDFGKKASLIGSEFKIAMTQMQASLIPVINLVDKLFNVSGGAAKSQRDRFINSSNDPEIVNRRNRIKELEKTTGGGAQGTKSRDRRIGQINKELQDIAKIGVARQEQSVVLDKITLDHDLLVKKTKEEFEMKKRVKELIDSGYNDAVAKQVANNNVLAEQAVNDLEKKRDQLFLQKAQLDPITGNREEHEKISDLITDINKKIDDTKTKEKEVNDLLKERGKTVEKVKVTRKEIADLLANETTNAVMGLIEGTKTLGEALASIAKSLAKMFLNAAFQNIFNSFLKVPGTGNQAQGAYNRVGGFKAFQQGGVVNSPMLGLIGEGGESEYVIPASKMDGAMARYSSGARGGSVIPGGSGNSGTVAGSSGNTVVEYTGPTLNFNGDEYVPKSAVPQIIGAASKQGAIAGKAQTFNTLRNSRSQRASLGL